MTNGCICCTLRDDLLAEVRRLAHEDRFDHLLIESTGIAEPLPVAVTFEFRDEAGVSLSDVATLDTMVTIVDTANLIGDYSSADFLRDRGETSGEGDMRTLVDLLVEQIEFADVLIFNKIANTSPSQRDTALKIVRALNLNARIVETDYGAVPLGDILGTGLFDFERAREYPLWYREQNGFAEHVPETEEYGIRSIVYRARAPMDPTRFQAFVRESWPGVSRAKGFFWPAIRPDHVGEIAQAGAVVKTEKRGLWWASVPRSKWPETPEWCRLMEPVLDPVWGGRQQEIVFIGTDPMDEATIRKRLDSCLVDAQAFTPSAWTELPDPFPNRSRQAA